MVEIKHEYAIGTFTSRQDAEEALEKLESAGLPIDRISVVSNSKLLEQLQEAIKDSYVSYQGQSGTGAPCAMITGSILGAIGGCLASIGILASPVAAPAFAIGAVGTALASTLAGAGVGLASGGLISACSAGMTSKRAIESDRSFLQEYQVIVNGTNEEILRAEKVLFNN
jgi:hypothetical protein